MRKIVSGDAVVRWVAQRTHEFGNFGSAVGIGIERDNSLIGGVVYNNFNGASFCMHTAAVEGAPWLYKGSLFAFFHYPFIKAGVNVVIAPVGEGNAKSRALVEGVGFSLTSRLAEAHPTGDMLMYTMNRKDCRWIGEDYAKAA